MFAVNRKYPFLKKFIIFVFSVPLMFAGGSLLGDTISGQVIGSVGDFDIPQNEFAYRYQNAVERYRRQSGRSEIPPHINEAIIAETQQDISNTYLLKAAISQLGIHAPDKVVAREIRNDPSLQEDGQFSISLYHQYVTSPAAYKKTVRENANNLPLIYALQSVPVPAIVEKLANFRQEQRVVAVGTLPARQFAPTLTVSAEDIETYYQQNISQYRLEEHGIFEYFTFSPEHLAQTINITEEDIELAYELYREEKQQKERRQISHLFSESREKIDDLYQQLQQGGNFTDLAQTHSEDIGSAINDGIMGIFVAGDLPIAIDEVAFAAEAGSISAPIAVEGGYSIIRVDKIIAEPILPLSDITDDITQQAKQMVATEQLEDTIIVLSQMAPNEIGSLEALAQAVNQTVQRATLYKTAISKNPAPFTDEDTLDEIFDPTIIQESENSTPIPVDPLSDTDYVVVRAINYQPASIQNIDIVASDIAQQIKARLVASDLYLAIDQTQNSPATTTLAVSTDTALGETLALLDKVEWVATQTIQLEQDEFTDNGPLSNTAVEQIFTPPVLYPLPSYIFLPQKDGLQVVRLDEIRAQPAFNADIEVIENIQSEVDALLGSASYIEEISKNYSIKFYDLPPTGQYPTNTPLPPQ